MVKSKNKALLLMGGVVVLLLALIATVALAQDATPEATPAPEQTAPESDGSFSLRGLGHFGGFGHSGEGSDWLEYLAEALGITVDELAAAQDQASAAAVADAVTAGEITQAQADAILAKRALSGYVDREAILATALGMTAGELEAALAGGQSLADIMTERDIDAATLQTNAQAAYEAAVQQAVTDGVITQAQADEFLSAGSLNLFGHGGRGSHGGHGGRGGHGGGFDLTPDSTTPDTAPDTVDTGFDA